MFIKKGFILLESIISNFIIMLIFLIIIKSGIYFLDDKYSYDKDYKKIEIILTVLEDIADSIELRELVTDDLLLEENRLLIRINKDILKYEFKDGNLYISSLENSEGVKLENAKNFKYKVSVMQLEKLSFSFNNNLIVISISDDNFKIKRVVNYEK